MPVKTVADLFLHELSDTYSAEKQMTRSLPKMARAASDPQLAQAFLDHLEETRGQVERIDHVVELLNLKLKRIKCAAMEGLVEEGKDLIDEIDKGAVLDVALIGVAQKVEHYEIASYNTLITLATKLGYEPVLPLLKASLTEEQATDEKLGKLGQAAAIEEAAEGEKVSASKHK
ncbi:ferritin-like domain-containing protein [Comamonas sp.]|uniref:YciE/YciF ferroxidase family protein n=1 Tax=Comamonas sp. TaxID=34028 RepID=UPI0028AACE42|nr:ferritin-like domain-containing protein [Comamonas sp.]